ncbi:bestrophin family ion channel [uncultured Aliiroseovarius sp.]|uniref:bestrophin family protein n=1 Tax=uncultured Aliiroseovarius sp. TaxID=1658783 RepID=UPI0025927B65|nr:bestrophin family ion channel [uncultured Aliiroseovarius sp.]
MIVRDPPSALRLFFIMQGSVVPRIIGKMGFVLVLTLTVVLIDTLLTPLPRTSLAAMSVFGVALSLFLGFRNNAAYARWWEARTLWGGLIADTRTLARQLELFGIPPSDRPALLTMTAAFAHAHRGSLRRCDVQDDVAAWIGKDKALTLLARANPADGALGHIAEQVAKLKRSGVVDGFAQMALADTLSRLALSQAGCERIRTTPLPFVYSLLVRRTTYLYSALLPFALLGSVEWFAPVFAVVVAYVFFGLQAVTNELEHPFDLRPNGLPLDAMCRVIERTLCDAMDQTTPPEAKPVDHILT